MDKIDRPTDPARLEQLRRKLDEYTNRYNLYRAPELQMHTICKIAVLERLLQKGSVDVTELAIELSGKFGSGFNSAAFENACEVIEDYATTGGAKTVRGTGLPRV